MDSGHQVKSRRIAKKYVHVFHVYGCLGQDGLMKMHGVAIGIAIGSVIGFLLVFYGADLTIYFFQDNFSTVVFILLSILVLVAIVYIAIERAVGRVLGRVRMSSSARASESTRFLKDVFPQLSQDALNQIRGGLQILLGWIVIWRVGAIFVTAIFGIAATIAGVFTTYILVKQNEIMEAQSSLIGQQVISQNAARFSAFAPIVTDLVSDIVEEGIAQRENHIADRIAEGASPSIAYCQSTAPSNLSPQLTSRILSVVSQLEPYVYPAISRQDAIAGNIVENDYIYLSPERGNILESLISYGFSLAPLRGADFSFADLRGKHLVLTSTHSRVPVACDPGYRADITQLDLSYADFRGSSLNSLSLQSQEGMRLNDARLRLVSLTVNPGMDFDFTGANTIRSDISVSPLYSLEDEQLPPLDLRGVVCRVLFSDSLEGCIDFGAIGPGWGGMRPYLPRLLISGFTLEVAFTNIYYANNDEFLGPVLDHARTRPEDSLSLDTIRRIVMPNEAYRIIAGSYDFSDFFDASISDVRAFASIRQRPGSLPYLIITFV